MHPRHQSANAICFEPGWYTASFNCCPAKAATFNASTTAPSATLPRPSFVTGCPKRLAWQPSLCWRFTNIRFSKNQRAVNLPTKTALWRWRCCVSDGFEAGANQHLMLFCLRKKTNRDIPIVLGQPWKRLSMFKDMKSDFGPTLSSSVRLLSIGVAGSGMGKVKSKSRP